MSRTHEGVSAVVAAAALVLCGCSSPDAEPTASPSSEASSTSPSAPAPEEAATTPPADPTPGSMDTPATTSGPLSRKSFPRPRALGAGWRYAVDPGDVEEGYSGNGTPTLERSPAEIVQTAVPIGCERSATLPAPLHALEVDYTVRGRKAIAVRSKFTDAGAATDFFDGRATDLRRCAGVVASKAIGPVVARISSPDATTLLNDRTPRSDPWREVAVLDRDTVLLLAVRGVDTLTPAETRHVVQEARR